MYSLFFYLENATPGKEKIQLPTTVDRDDEDDEEKKTSQVCYFILPDQSTNNSARFFHVEPVTHILSSKIKLDREKGNNHTVVIFATEDCHLDMTKIDISRVEETSLLRVVINVKDVNDNAYVSFTLYSFQMWYIMYLFLLCKKFRRNNRSWQWKQLFSFFIQISFVT